MKSCSAESYKSMYQIDCALHCLKELRIKTRSCIKRTGLQTILYRTPPLLGIVQLALSLLKQSQTYRICCGDIYRRINGVVEATFLANSSHICFDCLIKQLVVSVEGETRKRADVGQLRRRPGQELTLARLKNGKASKSQSKRCYM